MLLRMGLADQASRILLVKRNNFEMDTGRHVFGLRDLACNFVGKSLLLKDESGRRPRGGTRIFFCQIVFEAIFFEEKKWVIAMIS